MKYKNKTVLTVAKKDVASRLGEKKERLFLREFLANFLERAVCERGERRDVARRGGDLASSVVILRNFVRDI